MNFHLLSKIISELSRLSDAGIDRVYEDYEKNIILILRKQGKNFYLLISPDRSLPRIHLLQSKPPASSSLHPFTLYLKSRAAGGRIREINLLNQDRLAAIRFRRQETSYDLIIELLGCNANVILSDANRTILSVYHTAAPSEASKRILLPGASYQLPHFANNARNSAKEINESAAETGILIWNNKAEKDFDSLLNQKRFAADRAKLASVVTQALKKAGRLRQNLEQDKSRAENAELYRTSGELILANLELLRTGMEQAELTGYDGIKQIVTLDPMRSPKKNAELCFKKYKKAKAGRTIVGKRLQDAESEILFLQSLRQDLECAHDEKDLQLLRSRLEKKSYIRPAQAPKKTRSTSPDNTSFRKIFYQNWEIVVGKSSAGNDYITTKIAGPDDLWLHAEGMPGSHVIVKNPGNKDLPEDVLLKAASLAAYYSKGRASGKVSVTYTQARNVRKPKGAKPGLVMLVNRKSIVVTPNQG